MAATVSEDGHFGHLWGNSAPMRRLYEQVARVAVTAVTVFITGESGTGKSLIARAIHDFSDRRTLPFVVVQASDLQGMDGPATLMSRARGGSLVFDEVADYDEDTQARVVRMLDLLGDNAPRIMATSQADLAAQMEAGKFRKDLYYRLAGVTLSVPPLPETVTVSDVLRSSMLLGDVQAWQQAWQQLDATAVADLLQHVKATGQGTLSLCSEHTAHTYTAAPAAWYQRTTRTLTRLFNKPSPAAALQALITT